MSALALAVMALAACTAGGSSKSDPDPSQSSASVDASCDALDEIESYRYSVSLQLDVPAPTSTAVPEATPDPLGNVATALSELFRDLDLDGAFVAPDRSEILIRPGEDEVEIRTIGDKSWIRAGEEPWQEQEPPDEDVLFTPATICADIVKDLAPSLAAGSGTKETVNGIDTVHYELDEADIKSLPELLGRSGEEGLPSVFNVDVWLERDEGWPVRLQVEAAETDAQGEAISQELFLEFRDINDPNIEIEPPPVSPAQT